MECPSCSQPFICTSTLHNPDRLIYVHRQSKGKNPIDYCVDLQSSVAQSSVDQSSVAQRAKLLEAIKRCNEINSRNIEKGVASQLSAGVEWEKVQVQMNQDHKSKNREKKMAQFVGFDKAALTEKFPSGFGVGRSTKPSVAVMDNGRIQFSTQVSVALDGCTVVLPGVDSEANKLRFEGYKETPKGKENKVWDITRAKPAKNGKQLDKSCGISGALILKAVGYDYKTAGNQTFDVERCDNEKHVIVFALPKETPKPRAKQVRVKKAKNVAAPVVAATAPNGGVSTPSNTPAAAPETTDDIVVDN